MQATAGFGLQQRLAATLVLAGILPLFTIFVGCSALIKPRIRAQSLATSR